MDRHQLVFWGVVIPGLLLGMLGCQESVESQSASLAPAGQTESEPDLTRPPSLVPTLVPTLLLETRMTVPTVTPENLFPTLPPTHTPISTRPTPSVTPSPTPLPIDRGCPDQSPAVPGYVRARTGDQPLQPRSADLTNRFWLEKPLPGGGRFLTNTTFPYGYDARGAYLLHNGVDSAAPQGTPVLAIGDGTVLVAQSDERELFGWRCDWYGQLVVIELDRTWQGQPMFALYGHVLNIQVRPGQKVKAGEQLAEVGVGGAASVPHLHFELRVGANDYGATRNPLLWIRPPETRGVVAGRLVDPNGRPWHGIWLRAVSLEDGETEYITWTYLDDPRHLINSDEKLGENFVLADVLPGDYRIYVQIQDVNYRADVTVEAGALAFVKISTEFYREDFDTEQAAEAAAEDEN